MRLFSGLAARLVRLVKQNADLIGLWFVLLLAQHFVPVGNVLAREDLLPWMGIALSGVAYLRGRILGAGPHPMLTRQWSANSRFFHRLALAVVPWFVITLHEAARTWEVSAIGQVGGIALAVILLLAFSKNYDRTAWRPQGSVAIGTWILTTLALMIVVVGSGLLRRFVEPMEDFQIAARAVGVGITLGMAFLTVGLVGGKGQNHKQRVLVGRKDDKAHHRTVFPSFLAAFGPSVGLVALYMVLPDLDFDFAFVVTLLVIVWGAVIWPHPVPEAVVVVLHEVKGTGGRDRPPKGRARPFDRPPEGALRFSPLRIKRTRIVHTWYVPVQASRIADLDDPVSPLWQKAPRPQPLHILGDARFEPDPLTKGPQWDVLTVHLRSQQDVTSLDNKSDAKTRRMVVLRAFPPGVFGWLRSRVRTYRWDKGVPRDAVQVLDHTTERANLRTGDVIVLSTEGVAHAYEVEIGAPVRDRSLGVLQFRSPQLEDYVKA